MYILARRVDWGRRQEAGKQKTVCLPHSPNYTRKHIHANHCQKCVLFKQWGWHGALGWLWMELKEAPGCQPLHALSCSKWINSPSRDLFLEQVVTTNCVLSASCEWRYYCHWIFSFDDSVCWALFLTIRRRVSTSSFPFLVLQCPEEVTYIFKGLFLSPISSWILAYVVVGRLIILIYYEFVFYHHTVNLRRELHHVWSTILTLAPGTPVSRTWKVFNLQLLSDQCLKTSPSIRSRVIVKPKSC